VWFHKKSIPTTTKISISTLTKISIPTPTRVIGNLKVEEFHAQKTKFKVGKEKTWYFWGDGVEPKKPSMEEVWVFSGTTQQR